MQRLTTPQVLWSLCLFLLLSACGGKNADDKSKDTTGGNIKLTNPKCKASIFASDEVSIMDTTTRLFFLKSPEGSAECADYYRALGDSLAGQQNGKTLTFVYFVSESFDAEAPALMFPKPLLHKHFVAYYAKQGTKPSVVKTKASEVNELR